MLVKRADECLTEDLIQRFLAELERQGRGRSSLESYRYTLSRLYEYLPASKSIGANTCEEWRDWMCEQGFATRTVNRCVATLNSLLEYMGHRDWQGRKLPEPKDDVQPELTRAEYLRLLSTAKLLGRERTYLLVKTLGGAGVRLQELPQLTVEAVRRGVAKLERQNQSAARVMHLPGTIQRELLEYIRSENIGSGPVFVTRSGKMMNRAAVQREISLLARDAQVDSEKTNPRALWKMYQTTQDGIQNSLRILADQTYERMLEEEQLTVGWEA